MCSGGELVWLHMLTYLLCNSLILIDLLDNSKIYQSNLLWPEDKKMFSLSVQ